VGVVEGEEVVELRTVVVVERTEGRETGLEGEGG